MPFVGRRVGLLRLLRVGVSLDAGGASAELAAVFSLLLCLLNFSLMMLGRANALALGHCFERLGRMARAWLIQEGGSLRIYGRGQLRLIVHVLEQVLIDNFFLVKILA